MHYFVSFSSKAHPPSLYYAPNIEMKHEEDSIEVVASTTYVQKLDWGLADGDPKTLGQAAQPTTEKKAFFGFFFDKPNFFVFQVDLL